ncbi:unnamed protein product [Ambrosiozyma monospora]|uniref:Unnamed protein product n=1 Tax=Ambrosiozyma monospora TaxID=43982 RepID=A0ACB5T1U5_AMBMO|nr:unnamed protein product [Ambrosiozyma monospora]
MMTMMNVRRSFVTLYSQYSLPILQYLPVPEGEQTTTTTTRTTAATTMKSTTSTGLINEVLMFSKPFWFVPSRHFETETEILNNLDTKYRDFVENLNTNLLDILIAQCPRFLADADQVLTQVDKKTKCGVNLRMCLLDELGACSGCAIEFEFNFNKRLEKVLPEEFLVNGVNTSIMIDFVLKRCETNDGTPVLLVQMKKLSMEHLFDDDNLSTYRTQSILRLCYIYHWLCRL